MFPETGWWAALFLRQDMANPHPQDDLPPAEAPWPPAEEQPCPVPGIDVVPWAGSPLHRQATWVIYTSQGKCVSTNQRVKCNTLDQTDA